MATKEGLEQRKQACLKKIEDSYYDVNSPFYKDNERYKWASEVIEKQYSDTNKNRFLR